MNYNSKKKSSFKKVFMWVSLVIFGAIMSVPLLNLTKKVPVVGQKLSELRDEADKINVG